MANPEHVEIVKAGTDAIAEWRKENPSLAFDLTDADLTDADLTDADLDRADLNGANLKHTILNRATLIRADLQRTDLTGASLGDANLTHAKLAAANLTAAELSYATLNHAILIKTTLDRSVLKHAWLFWASIFQTSFRGTNLTRTVCGSTKFNEVDLSGAIGLENVEHKLPSSLSIDTLELSGRLPDSFLRGCGVPEHWITFIPSLVGNPIEFYSCFISYSHADKQFARQLHDRLQGQGIRCWLDEHELKPGDDIYKGVDRGIRVWDKVLLCCSEASLNSPWVEREVDTAVEKEMELQKSQGKQVLKIIPLNLDGSLFKWEGSHAAILRKRLAADFTNWKRNADKFDEQFERVVKALRTDDGPPAPEPKLGT